MFYFIQIIYSRYNASYCSCCNGRLFTRPRIEPTDGTEAKPLPLDAQ